MQHSNATDAQPDNTPDDPAGLPPADPALGPLVRKAVAKRHYAIVATASASGRPHSAGVLYQLAGDELWWGTLRSSRKARNIAANPWIGVVVPIRRLPVGPPSAVQFQGPAEVVGQDHPDLRRLVEGGALPAITGHGELELDGACFVRVRLPSRVPTYGLGMSLLNLIRHPLEGGRMAAVDWTA